MYISETSKVWIELAKELIARQREQTKSGRDQTRPDREILQGNAEERDDNGLANRQSAEMNPP